LDDSYGTSLRVEQDPGRFTLERTPVGLVSVDRMTLAGEVGFDTDPVAMFTVMECTAGHGVFRRDGLSDDLAPGEVMATAPPGHGYRGSCGALDIRLLNLDLSVLEEVAAEAQGLQAPLRFRELRAVERRDAVLWNRLVDFVALASRPDRLYADSLAERELARTVARTALQVFPNTTWDTRSPAVLQRDGRNATAATVRRAIAFIESAADRDLSLADIAAAAHASPRALQVAFRRHLDTTPMRFLQHIRLQQARRDLLDADARTTVARVASRWGFYNHGRFAAAYREQFGELPSVTLGGVTEPGHAVQQAGRVEREPVGGVDDDGRQALLEQHRRSQG
jgi:AraC-like DNA-binding protein